MVPLWRTYLSGLTLSCHVFCKAPSECAMRALSGHQTICGAPSQQHTGALGALVICNAPSRRHAGTLESPSHLRCARTVPCTQGHPS